MHNIDEDNITQAVIARHAAARDARARDVMTSLVQHLHAFAREVKLTEAEWAEGIRFLTECGRLSGERRQELVLLSDTLGLSSLVTALNQRRPKGCTESTVAGPLHDDAAAHGAPADAEPCFVRGRVRALDGTPIGGAEVRVWHADGAAEAHAHGGTLTTAADGSFQFNSIVAEPRTIPHDGPVGRMLAMLGREPWRPAHLRFAVSAPGYQRLVTHVFRQGDRYLDSDAVFGVRSSLVAEWVPHAPGRTPAGQHSAVPFTTLDFTFVLDATQGDKT